MRILRRLAPAAAFAGLSLLALAASADGIDAGLWKITTRIEGAGPPSAPRESAKCLTSEQVQDLPATFSPMATTVNSECEPMQRSFDGRKLAWHLVCKGQLDMELSGDFDFDTPHHYTGTVRTSASMAGQEIPPSQQTVEGQWVSACPQ